MQATVAFKLYLPKLLMLYHAVCTQACNIFFCAEHHTVCGHVFVRVVGRNNLLIMSLTTMLKKVGCNKYIDSTSKYLDK